MLAVAAMLGHTLAGISFMGIFASRAAEIILPISTGAVVAVGRFADRFVVEVIAAVF